MPSAPEPLPLARPPIDLAILAHHALHIRLPLRTLRTLRRQTQPQPGTRHYAIIPADIGDPAGSLGDLAMLAGLMQALRARDADVRFTIIGQGNHAIEVPGVGKVPVVAAWRGIGGTRAFDRLIRAHHGLFVMGADILDGKYGAAQVARIAAYCNHSVRLGIPATILGFSFNQRPRWPGVRVLSRLHPAVSIHVRDAPSLARFTRLVGIPAHLSADCAFLMPATADPSDAETETWIAVQREAGRTPVGINLGSHALAPARQRNDTAQLVEAIAAQLAQAARQHTLSLLLIPHDFKPESGDVSILHLLEQRLRAAGLPHVRRVELRRPDRIKHLAGLLDLVLTGRMHLAIAALGAGTPVLSVTYQDKFEGLYQHFGLSLDHTLQAEDCLDATLAARLDAALALRTENRARIVARLPEVLALAARNLELRSPGPARHDLSVPRPAE